MRLHEDAFIRNLKRKQLRDFNLKEQAKIMKINSKSTAKFPLERLMKPLSAKEFVNIDDKQWTFQPEIWNKSKFIAVKMRMNYSLSSKNNGDLGSQSDLYSRSITQKKASQIKYQNAKSLLEDETNKECTFKPAINKRKSSFVNASCLSLILKECLNPIWRVSMQAIQISKS